MLDRTSPPNLQGPRGTDPCDFYREENALTFWPHKDVYVFTKFSMKGGSLMRKRSINCKPQLRYTCYLYLILFFSITSSEEMWIERKARAEYFMSIKGMSSLIEFLCCCFYHIRIFLFFTCLGKESLLRNINCNPHWRAMQLPKTKIGIYQVRYTCYLSSIYVFLDRQFRS